MKAMVLVVAALVVALAVATAARAQEKKPVNAAAPNGGAAPDPAATCTPLEKDRNRHEGFLRDREAAMKKGPIQLVFVGDSITDAWRGGPQHEVYEQRWGKYNPLNLGISGDKTQNVLWRLEHGELDDLAESAKLVVIMIGTNNLGHRPAATPEQTARGVTCVVKSVRAKLPNAKVLLLGVFPRGEKADDPYRAQIKTVNDTIAKLADGKQVRYLDIGKKFLADDGTLTKQVMPDALHPSAKGYEIWADAIDPVVKEMMGGSAR